MRTALHLRPMLASVILALSLVTSAWGQQEIPDGKNAQFRQSGVLVTLAENLSDQLEPTNPSLSFPEDVATLAIQVINTSESAKSMQFSITPTNVEGTSPDQDLWASPLNLSDGDAKGFWLNMPAEGLSLGSYTLSISGDVTGQLEFQSTSPHIRTSRIDRNARPGNGENLALSARGGNITPSSEYSEFYNGPRLNDGLAFFHAVNDWSTCGNCGWIAAETDRQPQVLVTLGSEQTVPVSAIVFDTNVFVPQDRTPFDVSAWFPKVVRLTAIWGDVRTDLGTYRLWREFGRHLLAIETPILASAVQIEVLETFGSPASFSEVEIYASADHPTSQRSENLIAAGTGGALVRFTGFSDDAPAAFLADGDQTTPWVSEDQTFPQDFTFAFSGDQSAMVDYVELVPTESYNGESWPSEFAVALSDSSPLDGFEEVGRLTMPMQTGSHRLLVDRETRFIKIRLLSNHGAAKTTLGEIRVIGRPTAGTGINQEQGAGEQTVTIVPDAISEQEPNNSMAEANDLPVNQTLRGEVSPLGEYDYFRLPSEAHANTTLTIDYDGIPNIRHELGLHAADGTVISYFDPGDLPARNARLSFLMTGEEQALSLSEPTASIVVVWDTSGSMNGREAALEEAVREYVRLAPPNQAIRLVRFSSDIEDMTPDFTTDKEALLAAMNGKFAADGSTRLYEAIQHAMSLLSTRRGNRAIVVMTDGADYGNLWFDDLWRDLELNRYRLYTIGLGNGLEDYYVKFGNTGERILRHLALGTDGEAFFARDSAALTEFYARIANQLASPATYMLTPRVDVGQGTFHVETTAEQVPKAALPAIHVIFDLSGSMNQRLPDGRRRIDVAKQALYTTLDALPEGAPFGLTIYGARIPERAGKDVACEDVLTVKEVGPLVRQPVIDFIADLEPAGGTTPLARSIDHVVRNFQTENGGIVIAITDGIEECDQQPLLTIQDLQAAGLEAIELNVIGFDLRDQASREMMNEIAAIGGGRFYDASDGEALTQALRQAIAASYVVRDATGREIATGKIDGPAQSLPAGYFTLEFSNSDSKRRVNEVRIEAEHLTQMQINKVGDEIDIVVLEPQEADPRQECGIPASRSEGGAARVMRIQQKLNAADFETGTPDGAAGPKTRAAANAFRSANNLATSDDADLLLEQHLDCVASIGATFRP